MLSFKRPKIEDERVQEQEVFKLRRGCRSLLPPPHSTQKPSMAATTALVSPQPLPQVKFSPLAIRRKIEKAIDAIRIRSAESTSEDVSTLEFDIPALDKPTEKKLFASLDRSPMRKLFRLSWNPIESKLFARLMVTSVHHYPHLALYGAINNVLVLHIGDDDTGLAPGGAATIELGGDGGFKEGDSTFIPSSRPVTEELQPSLVIEVGVAESRGKLHADAARWIEAEGSKVKMVVLISITGKRSDPQPTVVIEKLLPLVWDDDEVNSSKRRVVACKDEDWEQGEFKVKLKYLFDEIPDVFSDIDEVVISAPVMGRIRDRIDKYWSEYHHAG